MTHLDTPTFPINCATCHITGSTVNNRRQDNTTQHKTRQHKTSQDNKRQHNTRQHKTTQDIRHPDSITTGQDRTNVASKVPFIYVSAQNDPKTQKWAVACETQRRLRTLFIAWAPIAALDGTFLSLSSVLLTRVSNSTQLVGPFFRLKLIFGRSSDKFLIERLACSSLALTCALLLKRSLAYKIFGLSCKTLGLQVQSLYVNLTHETHRSDHLLLPWTFSPRLLLRHIPKAFSTSIELYLLAWTHFWCTSRPIVA